MSIYTDNGFESRAAYLKYLAEENDVALCVVRAIASILGPDEDFDGLVTAVQDVAEVC